MQYQLTKWALRHLQQENREKKIFPEKTSPITKDQDAFRQDLALNLVQSGFLTVSG